VKSRDKRSNSGGNPGLTPGAWVTLASQIDWKKSEGHRRSRRVNEDLRAINHLVVIISVPTRRLFVMPPTKRTCAGACTETGPGGYEADCFFMRATTPQARHGATLLRVRARGNTPIAHEHKKVHFATRPAGAVVVAFPMNMLLSKKFSSCEMPKFSSFCSIVRQTSSCALDTLAI